MLTDPCALPRRDRFLSEAYGPLHICEGRRWRWTDAFGVVVSESRIASWGVGRVLPFGARAIRPMVACETTLGASVPPGLEVRNLAYHCLRGVDCVCSFLLGLVKNAWAESFGWLDHVLTMFVEKEPWARFDIWQRLERWTPVTWQGSIRSAREGVCPPCVGVGALN